MKSNKKNFKQDFSSFDALKLTLASPEQILEWSYGEVKKAETINYRTFKNEPDGLFCERIFGPSKNYECFCGKYKKVRYKGIICDKCGVEVTTKDKRRERMGHINLAVPATHVWFAYGVPNKMAILLDMSHKKMLSVVYYTRYMVVSVESEKREVMITKLEDLLKSEKGELESSLAQDLNALNDEYDALVEETKKKEKDASKTEFKVSQVDHKRKQAVAKVRRDYADKEEELDQYFSRLVKLLREVTVGSILTEDEYVDLADRDLLFFDARMGAEAIEELLKQIDIEAEIKKLRASIKNEKSKTKKLAAIRRLQFLQGFERNAIDPAWMVIKTLPVIPPELRPIIPLSGGKFATSDLNDLYRRIINRNNRLRRLIEIGAPDVILRNEKRMLQESVDAVLDNSHRPAKPMLNSKKLPYRSLADELRGKKGIFRRNLLGKRVDYSGRAVIVGDTALKFDQCGLPKPVALEMFKPFVIHELMKQEIAPNIKVAKEMIDAEDDRVWDVVEKIIKGRPVLLNRAPTLHKYSIQGFYPVLVEGDAIRIHPLVCKAFNADFDGDQMAVHVLLSDEAIQEAKDKMMSSQNVFSIANGSVMASPTKEMLLGFYLMTDLVESAKPRIFGDFEECVKAYQRGAIGVNEEIVVRGKQNEVLRTSVGRVIFNMTLPDDYPFINKRVGKNEIDTLIDSLRLEYPHELIIDLLDELKTLGFKYATDLGFSFAMEDCHVDIDLKARIKEIEEKDAQLRENYMQGLLTEDERQKLSTNMWSEFTDVLAQEAWSSLDKNNAVYEMVTSGANGGMLQSRQIMSIKGLVRNSSGDWIQMPIKGNYRDGLSAFEYFVATGGGRKGVADMALRTASSGYLTRRLHDVAHDVIIRHDDCKYEGDGLTVKRSDVRRLSFEESLRGRVLAKDLKDQDGNLIAKANEIISKEVADKTKELGISEVFLRSPILCKSPLGICQMCYGHDIESNQLISMGKAAGVIAAQSIGEPGTQMTLRSFHFGGAMKVDITQGLPRVEELLEARTPKAVAAISSVNGKVSIDKAEDSSAVIIVKGNKHVSRSYVVTGSKKVNVEDGAQVKASDVLFIDSTEKNREAPFAGTVHLAGGVLTVSGTVEAEETVSVLPGYEILVQDGQEVVAGTQLTEGSVDPKVLADVASIEKAQEYVLREVQAVFSEQGVAIDDVHVEVIVRQMARLGMVLESGDSDYLVGSLVNRFVADLKNGKLLEQNKNVSVVSPKLIGIKASALKTESFLSAMSFQEQVRVLTESAITGKVDYLRGMKENVLIGRRIPSGDDAMIQGLSELDEVVS